MSLLALCCTAVITTGGRSPPPPAPAVPSTPPPLSFAAPFGDNMVLQQQPAIAAVYGFGGSKGVTVTITDEETGKVAYTVEAKLNVTAQPFGDDFGVRPANTYNPWNAPLPTWKALLKPTPPGGSFTIKATTASLQTVSISNVAFGDMWYCSGQSNMWLPVSHTYGTTCDPVFVYSSLSFGLFG